MSLDGLLLSPPSAELQIVQLSEGKADQVVLSLLRKQLNKVAR